MMTNAPSNPIAIQERKGMPLDAFEAAYAQAPFELIDGERIYRTPQQRDHIVTKGLIYQSIQRYLMDYPLAEVFTESTFALVENGDWVKGSREPDVAVYLIDRWQAYLQDITDGQGPLTIAPDWVIEIHSDNDKVKDTNRKTERYLRDGVRLVWNVDPGVGTVQAYTADTVRIARAADVATGDPVLPAYQATVRDLLPTWFGAEG